MSPPPPDASLPRLASLVVEALELGTGKAENDVGGDLCRAFGIDLESLLARHRASQPNAKRTLRAAIAEALVERAGSASHLMTEVARCGGRFLAMVEEIYAFLAAHRATTAGTSEEFRFRKDGMDLELPISPAFIERIRVLQRSLLQIETGTIDRNALARFLGIDNGEFYGSWPVEGHEHSNARGVYLPLARAVTQLAFFQAELNARWNSAPSRANVRPALRGAVEAAEELVARAERLLLAHARFLRSAELDQLSKSKVEESDARYLRRERELLDQHGVLGCSVGGGYYEGFASSCFLGIFVDDLKGRPGPPGANSTPVRQLGGTSYHYGTSLSGLACLVALWRLGTVRTRAHQENIDKALLDPPGEHLRSWLAAVEVGCREATRWLETVVWGAIGIEHAEGLIESFEEYLNLPLWRHRHLLYEIWLLRATTEAAASGGWRTELSCLEREGGVWALRLDPAPEPVARLTLPLAEPLELLVWREPRREIGRAVVTPDISISTASSPPRDLVVVEGKDRYEMRSGAAPSASRRTGTASAPAKSAMAVAERYVSTLGSVVTWVCNHCDFRESDLDPSLNHGNAWNQLYLGSALRPGNVPGAFARSIRDGLRPPGLLVETVSPVARRLVLVIDTTGSMHRRLEEIFSQLRSVPKAVPMRDHFEHFRGVLFADHGSSEPYLVRDVGDFASLEELIDRLQDEPLGNGGDTPEALEDAIHHGRLLAEELGPAVFLVLTDAPPHSVAECPQSLDFEAELRRLLDGGSACFVASDGQDELMQPWKPFDDYPSFRRAPLSELLPMLAASHAVTAAAMIPSRAWPRAGAPNAGRGAHPSSR